MCVSAFRSQKGEADLQELELEAVVSYLTWCLELYSGLLLYQRVPLTTEPLLQTINTIVFKVAPHALSELSRHRTLTHDLEPIIEGALLLL